MPGDAEAARFKAAFERGEALFQAGDFGAAIANFKEADRARATPEVAWDLARCFERLGDEAFTLYYYRLYLRRAPNAPDTLEVAEKVGIVIARLEAEGKGVLELDAPRADAVTLLGNVYPSPPVAAFLPPGDYEVSAQFTSGVKTMSVQIRTRKMTTVTFEPVQPPLLHLEDALTAEQIAQGVEAAPSPGVKPLRVASYVVAAAGLAALIAGGTLGVLANGDKSDAQDKSLTVAQAQRAAQAANGKALGANLLFGIGGAAVAGGALMFVFSMPEPGMKSGASK